MSAARVGTKYQITNERGGVRICLLARGQKAGGQRVQKLLAQLCDTGRLSCGLPKKLAPAGVGATVGCCHLARLWVVHPDIERKCYMGEVTVDMYKYIYMKGCSSPLSAQKMPISVTLND